MFYLVFTDWFISPSLAFYFKVYLLVRFRHQIQLVLAQDRFTVWTSDNHSLMHDSLLHIY